LQNSTTRGAKDLKNIQTVSCLGYLPKIDYNSKSNMTKTRIIIFFTTTLIVLTLGYFASLYARGYKFNPKDKKITATGLLVIKSSPEAAQIFIDNELRDATNTTISLAPGTYDISVKKEGYHSWNKRLTIEKEIVTEINADLFKTAPSLSAITLSPVVNPLPSDDFTKIAYSVPATIENVNKDKEGLWIIETVNLPLGFAKNPKRITDGDLSNSTWQWSPDGREILLRTKTGAFQLNTGVFTAQKDRINTSSNLDETIEKWEDEKEKRFKAQLRGLPDALVDILANKTEKVIFSPDETKILYLAISDSTLPDKLIKPVPGASTQKEERDIKKYNTYVYDIKEDRNFFISKVDENTDECKYNTPALLLSCKSALSWFPTSQQLVLADEGKIIIMDYDSTNKQEVYSGTYTAPNAFPVVSKDRLMILTNLGANSALPNLYSIRLK